jgi:predicted sulfurtransferase
VIEQLLAERLEAEQRLSKGELYLFDQRFHQNFSTKNIRLLIQKKMEEEVYLLRNMFVD